MKMFILAMFLLSIDFSASAQGLRIKGFDKALPDPLIMVHGSPVKSVKQWYSQRRPELLKLFTREVYGQSPGIPENMRFKVFDSSSVALGGLATRKQVAVYFNGNPEGPRMDILIYLPNNVKRPVPVFTGLNFEGNQSVNPDTAIRITKSWEYGGNKDVINHHATEQSRGMAKDRWPLQMILAHGYGIATVYAGDIAPDDKDGFKNGVQALYPRLQNIGDNFATLAAWAWGLSRVMDYFETDRDIDPHKIIVFGWSRMGKAALWAGAEDKRFSIVISNESGAGGAKLFHHPAGENAHRLCTKFPYWFCNNFKQYDGKDTLLPFDQHELIALIAPRPVYIASAEGDGNSDPYGEFLAAEGADGVYRFLGTAGLPVKTWPAVNHPVLDGQIGYHIRSGNHNITPYDWSQYLLFVTFHLAYRPG